MFHVHGISKGNSMNEQQPLPPEQWTMPIGKYKPKPAEGIPGTPLGSIPSDYLEYMLGNKEDGTPIIQKETLRTAMRAVLNKRNGQQPLFEEPPKDDWDRRYKPHPPLLTQAQAVALLVQREYPGEMTKKITERFLYLLENGAEEIPPTGGDDGTDIPF